MSSKVHFLHIGKTGGSAIKEALKRAIKEQDIYANANKLKDNTELEIKRLSGRFDQIILHGHGKTLKQIPESDWFFFCIRNPISRYVSGFYSRKRQGKPRYNIPWNIKEKRAFKHFNTPNELAEALSSDNPKIRERAKRAMKNIRHVKTSLSKWIINPSYFEKRTNNLLFILEQDTLSEDFKILLQNLHFKRELNLSRDRAVTHQADTTKSDTTLSELAIANLNQHYAQDIEIYKFLTEAKIKKQRLFSNGGGENIF